MIDKCKVCETAIPPPKYGEDYWCIHCSKYSVVYGYWDNVVESETISVDNYYLCFLPLHKEANVVEKSDNNHRIINTFQLDELTHEVAVKWAEKLAIYKTFQ